MKRSFNYLGNIVVIESITSKTISIGVPMNSIGVPVISLLYTVSIRDFVFSTPYINTSMLRGLSKINRQLVRFGLKTITKAYNEKANKKAD